MAVITKLPKPVRYFDEVTPIQIGDIVATRPWFALFRKKTGRVVYVPGISEQHGEFEHHGLCWVGVKTPDGGIFGSIVLPETGCVQKSLQFMGRDESSCEAVTPDRKFPEE